MSGSTLSQVDTWLTYITTELVQWVLHNISLKTAKEITDAHRKHTIILLKQLLIIINAFKGLA